MRLNRFLRHSTASMVLASAGLAAGAPAHGAAFVFATPGAPDPGATGGLTIDFDSALPTGVSFAAGSQYRILHGIVSHAGYNPTGDSTYYLAVPGGGVSGSATLDFTAYRGPALGDFSLYWGSIDRANSLTVVTTLGSLNVLGGSLITRGYGSATSANANRRVGFSLAPGEKLLKLTLASPTSFEIDDIVFKTSVAMSTPEPATWAFLVVGFGFVGANMRRRTQVALAA